MNVIVCLVWYGCLDWGLCVKTKTWLWL